MLAKILTMFAVVISSSVCIQANETVKEDSFNLVVSEEKETIVSDAFACGVCGGKKHAEDPKENLLACKDCN